MSFYCSKSCPALGHIITQVLTPDLLISQRKLERSGLDRRPRDSWTRVWTDNEVASRLLNSPRLSNPSDPQPTIHSIIELRWRRRLRLDRSNVQS